MNTTIIIPARYASTRLPGKPLINIAGKTMLQRVVEIAKKSIEDLENISIAVATDDERICEHAKALAIPVIMTPVDCISGTDRALAAANQLEIKPDYIINFQGDAPFTPPEFITELIQALHQDQQADIATPVVQLSWAALDKLREFKQTTPFSGTTAVIDSSKYAIWFSKNIIPAIRKESKLREESKLSPIYRHIGLYGYSMKALEQYAKLPEGHYEALEGLEQLRALENNMKIKTVTVSYHGKPEMTGIDNPEDVTRAEQLIQQYGEWLL